MHHTVAMMSFSAGLELLDRSAKAVAERLAQGIES